MWWLVPIKASITEVIVVYPQTTGVLSFIGDCNDFIMKFHLALVPFSSLCLFLATLSCIHHCGRADGGSEYYNYVAVVVDHFICWAIATTKESIYFMCVSCMDGWPATFWVVLCDTVLGMILAWLPSMLVHIDLTDCITVIAIYIARSRNILDISWWWIFDFFVAIEVAPVAVHANLSSTDYATFYCRAVGRNTRWGIDDITYNTYNRTENGYIFSEITEWLDNGDVVHDMYLSIRASAENNETEVVCVVFVNFQILSDPVTLIVQGKWYTY